MNFFVRQLLKSKMKGVVPEAEQEKFLSMFEKNPDLFKKIAEDTQEKMKTGLSQIEAVKQVMGKYQEELKKISE